MIAVETNEPVPVTEPGPDCQKVAFSGGAVRGLVEVIDAPPIDGAKTLGVHRVLQTVINGARAPVRSTTTPRTSAPTR